MAAMIAKPKPGLAPGFFSATLSAWTIFILVV
jgi:hypothetical protein